MASTTTTDLNKWPRKASMCDQKDISPEGFFDLKSPNNAIWMDAKVENI